MAFSALSQQGQHQWHRFFLWFCVSSALRYGDGELPPNGAFCRVWPIAQPLSVRQRVRKGHREACYFSEAPDKARCRCSTPGGPAPTSSAQNIPEVTGDHEHQARGPRPSTAPCRPSPSRGGHSGLQSAPPPLPGWGTQRHCGETPARPAFPRGQTHPAKML